MPQQLELDRLDLETGDEPEHGFDRAEGVERLLMAMAVHQRAVGDLLQRKIEPPGVRLARQEFLEGQRLLGEPLAPLALHHRRHFVAEAEQAARLQTDHRNAARDERRRARPACARPRGALRRPCRRRERCGRSTAGATSHRRLGDMHAIAAGVQHRERRIEILALEIAVERIGEEHDLRSSARPLVRD